MDRFIYIHGFNSSSQSRSGKELTNLLGRQVICPEYDYSRPFGECLAGIRRQILDAVDENNDRLCVMGSSLGGFYALQLRHPAIMHVAVWNPVVFPAMQLSQFLGQNTRFSDGRQWEFTRDTLLSYAQASDPRPWRNEVWAREERRIRHIEQPSTPFLDFGGGRGFVLCARADGKTQDDSPALREHARFPRRDIFLGDGDEILDAGLARAFWQGAAELHDIVSGHQILDYSHALDILKKDTLLESFDLWQKDDYAAPALSEAGSFDMAGLMAADSQPEKLRQMLWLADVPFLSLEGKRNEASLPLVMIFFPVRHRERVMRLLAGLARLCGKKSYVLIRADGVIVRHQVAEHRVMDAEYSLPLSRLSLNEAIRAAFPGWQGAGAEWHGHELHGSFARATIREHFSWLWDNCEDPVAAFEKSNEA